MSNDKNKVKFNLHDCHWAPVSFDEGGTPTFGKYEAWPGAVTLSMDPQGDVTPFYADGITYYLAIANNGYSGDFETALVPEKFRQDIMCEVMDKNGVLIEKSNVEPKPFAFAFEIDGDAKARRTVLYNCMSTRNGIGSATIQGSKEPQADKTTLTATPLPNNSQVKAVTSSVTDPETYKKWYEQVYYNEEITLPANLTSLTIGSLTLTPAFNPNTTVYGVTTANATNTVTAIGSDGSSVKITVNGSELQSGSPATWNDGDNAVTVTVTNGTDSKAYTVTVTKGD